MADQRIYHVPGVDVERLSQALAEWFRRQGLEAQILPVSAGGFAVQARKEDTLRTISGLGAAISVTLVPQGENLMVEMGAAKWADKAAVSVAAAIIFWPALALPAYGYYKQKDLRDKTFEFIGQQLGVMPGAPAATAPVAAHDTAAGQCPSCGKALRREAKFCDGCGATLTLACAKCGAELRPGARFCDGCGAPVQAKSS